MSLFAYLDPGTGSIILQAVLGGAAGLAIGLKLFGRRVMSFLKFWDRGETPREPAAPTVDEG